MSEPFLFRLVTQVLGREGIATVAQAPLQPEAALQERLGAWPSAAAGERVLGDATHAAPFELAARLTEELRAAMHAPIGLALDEHGPRGVSGILFHEEPQPGPPDQGHGPHAPVDELGDILPRLGR